MNTPKSPISKSKQLIFSSIAILISLTLVFVIAEVLCRLFPAWTDDPAATPPYNYRAPHDAVGWVVKEGYHHSGELRDFKGNPYPIEVSFGREGFRKWGDPSSPKKKIFFIGDSYTACAQTSDDKLYYKLLGDSLQVEVFAYGAAGFGNTQELMIAEHYLKEIQPDIVVWELCCNDFLDNYWELEKTAGYHVRMRRPYTLEDGSIVYEKAEEWPRSVKKHSRFLYFLLKRIGEIFGTFDRPPADSSEKMIAEQNLNYEPFRRSRAMTATVFKKMKALIPPQTTLIAFDADGFQPQYDHFVGICQETGVEFLPGVDNFVHQREAAGECVRTDDGYHWNNRGNELVAAYLKKALEPRLAGPQTTTTKTPE